MTKDIIKEFNKEIMSEEEFRENTMGVFYQDELRDAFSKIKPFLLKALKDQREELYEKVEGLIGELHPSGHHIRRQTLEDILKLIKDNKYYENYKISHIQSRG